MRLHASTTRSSSGAKGRVVAANRPKIEMSALTGEAFNLGTARSRHWNEVLNVLKSEDYNYNCNSLQVPPVVPARQHLPRNSWKPFQHLPRNG
eukprot:COSAG02_NODE_5642_length_4160_cov_2.781335_6_plen_93_part_00